MSIIDSVPIISSFRKKNEAKEITYSAKRKHRNAARLLEDKHDESSRLVDDLFDLKVDCSTSVLEQAIDTLQRCQKVNREDTKVAKDSVEKFNKYTLPSLKSRSLSMSEIATGGIKGTAAGAALSIGAMGTISALGAASTGTAISTLSGAAASNATLAWFGGGALSAGGAGMAGGAIVLGGIALAPVLIVAAFKLASTAEKELTEAQRFRNQVNQTIAKIDAAIEIADAINEHVKLFHQTLLMMKERLIMVSEKTYSLLSEGSLSDKDINIAKYQLILFIRAIKRLLEVNLFNSKQQPTSDSKRIMAHIFYTGSEESITLGKHLESGHKITLPDDVKYLSEISPGIDSPKFFWLLDTHKEFNLKPKTQKKAANTTGFDLSQMTFKAAFILTMCSAIALLFASFNNMHESVFMISSGLFLFTFPPLWLAYKSKIKFLKILAWAWFATIFVPSFILF